MIVVALGRIGRAIATRPPKDRVFGRAHPSQDRFARGSGHPLPHVEGLEGHGLAFTIGRGTEICVVAARAFEPFIVGRTLEGIQADMRSFWRSLVADSRLRWLGPEKGVVHLAAAAVVNAVWDLWAKREGKPLWKLLVDLSPAELVACVDFSYVGDAL